jgi:arabinogalactan endo-1,4-beta-galactosidase
MFSYADGSRAIDLVFVVDSSAGVQWNKMKSFTKSLLNYFSISPAGTHVAYVVFSNGANLGFSFPLGSGAGFQYTLKDVQQSIDKVKGVRGNQRNIQIGLQLARRALTQPFGGRPNARKV